MRCLRDASAVLLLGSDDPAYAPSKIIPCVLAGRPFLAVLHRESATARLLSGFDEISLTTFDSSSSAPEISGRILDQWIEKLGYMREVQMAPELLAAQSTATMTESLCRIFDHAVGVF